MCKNHTLLPNNKNNIITNRTSTRRNSHLQKLQNTDSYATTRAFELAYYVCTKHLKKNDYFRPK